MLKLKVKRNKKDSYFFTVCQDICDFVDHTTRNCQYKCRSMVSDQPSNRPDQIIL